MFNLNWALPTANVQVDENIRVEGHVTIFPGSILDSGFIQKLDFQSYRPGFLELPQKNSGEIQANPSVGTFKKCISTAK